MFSGCTVSPVSKEIELGRSDQEASLSADKNTGIVLGSESLQLFRFCGYFWGRGVSFASTDEFSVRVTKLLQGLVSHELAAYLSVYNLFLAQ